jgi:uncharacterized protein
MKAQRLCIYLGERDKDQAGRPLGEAIVHEAHRRGLAGATVCKGIAGYGANSRVHTAKILRLSEDLPLVIAIVDAAERIAGFLPWLAEVIEEGLVTREDVDVVLYRSSREDFEPRL